MLDLYVMFFLFLYFCVAVTVRQMLLWRGLEGLAA